MNQTITTRNFLRDIRTANDLSQSAMATKLGCSTASIKRFEGTNTLPKNAAVLRNLRALGTLVNIEVP